ncbi:MAG: ABC transporter ATP-binding protein/permease [Alphaproteobacteria bacterium]
MEVTPASPDPASTSNADRVNVRTTVMEQLGGLLSALRRSGCHRRVSLLGFGIIAVIAANMVGQVRLNRWQGDFYDALERQALSAFLDQIVVFLVIAVCLLTLVVSETWLRQMLEVRLREWLSYDLVDAWLKPKRAYFLSYAGDIGDNPDQRMQADCQHLSELSADLGVGLIRSSLLLVSFVGVLWLLSDKIVFADAGQSFTIPGYLVWCALAFALAGSWLTWRIGRPLIALNVERYSREAALRFAMVRISEHAEGIALHGGEEDERQQLARLIDNVIGITRNIAFGLARLTWVTSGYGWLGLVVPIAAAAPGYFNGSLTFGELMMVVGAFNHVEAALRWFVDNFSRIADWRATLMRVATLQDTLPALDTLGEGVERVDLVQGGAEPCGFEDLSVVLPDSRVRLQETSVEILPGDRVVILGERRSGKSTLFRALAGLWPWGSGRVRMPPPERTMFMPQRPYIPLGSLRAVLAYPAPPDRFTDDACRKALERVDLNELSASLDQDRRWDKELTMDEQQRLAFARLLLHAPACVVLDDGMGALSERHRALMLSIVDQELADATLIAIGRERFGTPAHQKTLHVRREPNGAALRIGPNAATASA